MASYLTIRKEAKNKKVVKLQYHTPSWGWRCEQLCPYFESFLKQASVSIKTSNYLAITTQARDKPWSIPKSKASNPIYE